MSKSVYLEKFARNLQTAMANANINQANLVRLSGYGSHCISQYQRAQVLPGSYQIIRDLADVLQVKPSDLLSEREWEIAKTAAYTTKTEKLRKKAHYREGGEPVGAEDIKHYLARIRTLQLDGALDLRLILNRF